MATKFGRPAGMVAGRLPSIVRKAGSLATVGKAEEQLNLPSECTWEFGTQVTSGEVKLTTAVCGVSSHRTKIPSATQFSHRTSSQQGRGSRLQFFQKINETVGMPGPRRSRDLYSPAG